MQSDQAHQPQGATQENDDAPKLVKIEVEGNEYTINLAQVVESASAESTLWWADVLGRAEHARIMADAAYRQWRGARTIAVALAHPKRAEWKVRAEVDADIQFTALRLAVAGTERAVVVLRELVDVLKRAF